MFNDICLTIAELHNELDDLKNKTCKLGWWFNLFYLCVEFKHTIDHNNNSRKSYV